jgi:hypothetical protein
VYTGGREERDLQDREVRLRQLEESDEVVRSEESQGVWHVRTPGNLDEAQAIIDSEEVTGHLDSSWERKRRNSKMLNYHKKGGESS